MRSHPSLRMAPNVHVKMCIVMDCTSSMAQWIQQAKTRMVVLVNTVCDQNPGADVLVSFVGYRDYGDEEPMIRIPFGRVQHVMQRIQPVRAVGGNDEAEDVAHALDVANNMDWSNADVKIVFHVADAPAHGMVFHKPSVSDRFPRGDPHGLDPRVSVVRMSSKNIDFRFVRINESTDTMISEFYECYMDGGSFQVIDLLAQSGGDDHPGDPMMVEAMTQSVSCAIERYTSSQEP